MQKMRQALQRLMTEVPEAARGHPEIQAIAELTTDRACNIVHLIYQSKAFEGHSKDYEFGPEAMREHWQRGLDDIRRDRKSVEEGKSVSVRVDLGGGRIVKKKKR